MKLLNSTSEAEDNEEMPSEFQGKFDPKNLHPAK